MSKETLLIQEYKKYIAELKEANRTQEDLIEIQEKNINLLNQLVEQQNEKINLMTDYIDKITKATRDIVDTENEPADR